MASSVNRRTFLKRTATLGTMALTGGLLTRSASAASAAPRRGANEEIRVAVVGIRGQGRAHIRAHARAENVRVAALCDIDERLYANGIQNAAEHDPNAPAPRTVYDVRRLLDADDIDCLSIVSPNHWHALSAIWACQAGKDVFVEKPCSHNIFEGRKLVEAAAKYNRVVQHGTQNRSQPTVMEAMKLLQEGVIGEVYMARALCFKRRDSIGIEQDGQVPEGVHYDLWLGPAPQRPFNPNRFHYDWHWHWDYGNGDIGNQGVHQMDIAQWGLGKDFVLPVKTSSMGGRFTYEDQGITPNTQIATFQYDDGKMLVFEVRGRATHDEWGVGVGNLFYGSKGYMAIRGRSYETVVDGEPGPSSTGNQPHTIFTNFHDVVRSRKVEDLESPILEGHNSSALCHLANLAYRLDRTLRFDPTAERFVNDNEANTMLTRDYRAPYVVPAQV